MGKKRVLLFIALACHCDLLSSGKAGFSSLQYLSKKKWHPSHLSNRMKVWRMEEEERREKEEMEKRCKQIQEEREISRLKSMRLRQAGVEHDGSLDWMYRDVGGARPGLIPVNDQTRRSLLQGNDFRQEISKQVMAYDNRREEGGEEEDSRQIEDENPTKSKHDGDAGTRSALLMAERIQTINEQKKIEKMQRKRAKELKMRKRAGYRSV
uniref:CBF1-interacting co-repressor CIR N-terminal domain-containing protein n=1 Tax=Hanusia phi TaxID=3032 RepID=A0A7S0I1W8_9CRYP|mmetsp:Transcript_8087/g.18486  ORF Transcript_8087/g.18486 Transcript_8087/m.18486 type:complete len:210 (+) Transcript_8087:31-660(+)